MKTEEWFSPLSGYPLSRYSDQDLSRDTPRDMAAPPQSLHGRQTKADRFYGWLVCKTGTGDMCACLSTCNVNRPCLERWVSLVDLSVSSTLYHSGTIKASLFSWEQACRPTECGAAEKWQSNPGPNNIVLCPISHDSEELLVQCSNRWAGLLSLIQCPS